MPQAGGPKGRADPARVAPEAVLRAILDSAPIGIWFLGPDGRLVFVNRTYCHDVGISEEAFRGAAHYSSLYDAETAARCVASDREALASPGIHRSFETVPFADGSLHNLEIVKVRLEDAGGAVQGLIGLTIDQTKRNAAEERLRLMASVFESAQEGIIVTDAEGTILDVNPSFSAITGFSRTEAVGRNPRFLKSDRNPPNLFEEAWASVLSTGRWSGEVWNRRKDGGVYAEWLGITAVKDAAGHVARYVGVFTDISRIKRQEQELLRLAHHDPLTGLPNRVLLADRMSQAIGLAQRTGRSVAVAYLDLDAFKPVNDAFGHRSGDAVLVEVAARLTNALRSGDSVARFGGDEFVLLLPDLGSVEECEAALARVLSIVSEPIRLEEEGAVVTLSASIGVALYPHDEADPDALLRHADQAMYQAKRDGRNRRHFFDPAQDDRARERRLRLQEFREALSSGDLQLHYQPKVNMRTGLVLGAEGLVRWRHPVRGILLPAEFLHELEGSDLEIPFGEWVIATSLRQLEVWAAAGFDGAISVNIGARTLLAPGFANRLGDAFAAHPAARPERFRLEIVESIALGDLSRARKVLESCRQIGISFAIDDFGTGYSSLSYLRGLPVEELKIDRSFVGNILSDPGDLVIVEGVIALAAAFGRIVIAEGVETVDHGLALLRLGCDLGQGYGIARPMAADRLPAWSRTWRPHPSWETEIVRPSLAAELPLLFGEQQHRDWLQRVRAWAAAPLGSTPPPLDARACAIGRWIDGPGRLKYRGRWEFEEVANTHGRLHDVADRVAARAAGGAGPEAAELESALRAASELFLTRLRALKTAVLG